MTFHEPFNYCVNSYGMGVLAPAIESSGLADYMCIHNMLKAHAAAYHTFRNKYFKVQGGEVGIVMDSQYFFASENMSDSDQERAMQYRLGFVANPIFGSSGGYPQVMVDEINNRSLIEGRPFSRLPDMDEDLKVFIRGSSDFIGINYYPSSVIKLNSAPRDPRSQPSWYADVGITEYADPNNVPQGLRQLLKWIKKEFNNPRVIISENGWTDDGEIDDNNRIEYFVDHLNAVALAINEDGCNIVGYFAWSLLDSFEWNYGFTYKYGLFQVNSNMERIPKKSVTFWQNFLQTRYLRESSKFF